MIPLRLTVIGVLLSVILSLTCAILPIYWSCLAFILISIISRHLRAALMIAASTFVILVTSEIYRFSRVGHLDLEYLWQPELMLRSYILIFSFFFVPIIALTSSLELYDFLPRGQQSGTGRWGIGRVFVVQIAHRREALIHRAREIFSSLELRGVDVSTAIGRLRYAVLWLPILASTSFVEALESSTYESMLRIDIRLYKGRFRPQSKNATIARGLDTALIALSGALVYVLATR